MLDSFILNISEQLSNWLRAGHVFDFSAIFLLVFVLLFYWTLKKQTKRYNSTDN